MSVTTVPIQPIKKGSMIKLWLGIIVVVLVAAGLAFIGTQEAVATGATNEQFLANNADEEGVITTDSGLQYKVLKPGEGPSPIATDTALVKYEGSLRDGTVFDANEQTPMPVGAVVPGFSEALQLMQKGGEYRIWIPSELGYGEQSPSPTLPANSILIFDVTLIDFISAEQMQALQQQMQQQMPGGMEMPGQ
ncbi:MAG: FKBP-type peptidyl-prolyl cis-trans isomerase [Sphingorhabdus sp.]|jgi:FKBP-type peptidyl-prolyl cis-trans isomerase FkpA|nr:FKBP-type peptidyl-prolyl cis-trans isomerase [Sphingorhabdus sp.]